MHLLTHQNYVLNTERSPYNPVRYLLGYRDRLLFGIALLSTASMDYAIERTISIERWKFLEMDILRDGHS